MTTRRQHRVAELIQAEISNVLLRKLKDPRIGFVTITGVSMSPDLKHARVFFSTIGDQETVKRAAEGLHSAVSFIRGEIGRALDLKHCPHLAFHFDDSLERGSRIESRLRELGLGGAEKPADDRSDGEDEDRDPAS